ncbi:MAG TPA: PH domain-containing protein, partial [Thermoanaerobaculia bacterium]|nr:PH domain-containing protein [Thermoanaerobaculia bacterium]
MSWRDTVLRIMRVPPTPAPPPGSPPRVFRAAPNFFKLRVLRWAVTQLLAVAGLLWALQFIRWVDRTDTPQFVIWLLQLGEVFGWIAFTFEFFFGWMLVRLDFELRWYMLSDRAIRIREGITTVREKTIALANIQNIAVRQGPLQRFLGIADVEVKTAGGGGGGSDMEAKAAGAEAMHVAYFRGVDNAEEIRDLLREGVRRQ